MTYPWLRADLFVDVGEVIAGIVVLAQQLLAAVVVDVVVEAHALLASLREARI